MKGCTYGIGDVSTSGFKGATNTGSYEAGDYAGRGSFGRREAGSVLASAPLVCVPSAIAIAAESAAHTFGPGTLAPGVAGLSAWVPNLLLWFGLKVVAASLRNYGGPFLRDLGPALIHPEAMLQESLARLH